MTGRIDADSLDTYMEGGTGKGKELDISRALKEVKEDKEIKAEALRIYNSGNALDFMCKSCERMHADDKNIIRTLFLSCGSMYVTNCNGVNIEITGSAGSGKTHLVKAVLRHIPSCSKIKAKISDRALFYHDIREGTIIAYDDQELSEEMQSTIKNLSWDEPTELLTVKQQAKLSLSIPPRCPYWNTKAEGSGDEQIQDRVIKFWADESPSHNFRRDTVENSLLEDPHLLVEWEHDMKVSQEIWWLIRGRNEKIITKYMVIVPFAHRIKGGNGDARTRNLFISLIQSSCVMRAPLRDKDSKYGYLVATEDDFAEAAAIVNPLMRNKGGSQNQKLNRSAAAVLNALKEKESDTYPFELLMHWANLNNVQLNYAINGRRADGMDGLGAKCPALIVTSITTSKSSPIRVINGKEELDESWTKISASRKGIIWNKELYDVWSRNGSEYYLSQEPDESMMSAEEAEYLYQGYLHDMNGG